MIEGRGVLLPALERDSRKVEVLAVVAEAEESFRELDKLESCDVLRVISQAEWRLLPWPWGWPCGSSIFSGMLQFPAGRGADEGGPCRQLK